MFNLPEELHLGYRLKTRCNILVTKSLHLKEFFFRKFGITFKSFDHENNDIIILIVFF